VIRLAERTSPDIARVAHDARAVVLLPVGAIEQHGPHLPLLVDLLGAEELARLIAPRLRRAGFRPVLAPSLPYGVSTLAVGWSGTVSLSVSTFRRVVVEVVRSLAAHGFRRVVLTNYQADPDHLRGLALARDDLARDRGLTVVVAGFTPDARIPNAMTNPRVRRQLRSPQPDREWHSGELETAMVLATRPALVRRRAAKRLPPVWVDFRGALARGARNFRDLAPGGRGYFGAPGFARAGTGRAVMALRARLIARDVVATFRRPRRGSKT
jgi:creatinine amidohydrolase